MYFNSIRIKTTDQKDYPVALDKYYSINLNNFRKYNFQDVQTDEYRRKFGSYPVLTDAQMDEVNSIGRLIMFNGLKRGRLVMNETFIIGRDCCHIKLIAGKTQYKIDL